MDRALALSSPTKLTSSASFSPSIRISLRLKIHQAQAKNFCRVLDIRVTHIMEADSWASHLFHNRLEMDVQRLEADKHTVRAGENHIVLVVPAASGAQMHLVLLALGFAKNIQGGYSQGDGALFAVL